MSNKLEEYLEEISRYLPFRDSQDILEEIKNHVLEKAEHDHGTIDEESLADTIADYGPPRQVAEKYLEGYQDIAPVFKKYLFQYAAVLFLIHLGLTLAAWFLGTDIMVFPLFYIPHWENLETLLYLPMMAVFDFGLVAIFLYILTQKKADLRLPWPKLFRKPGPPAPPKAPRLVPLILMLIASSALWYGVLKYKTLFVVSADFSRAEPLMNPAAAYFYSLLLAAALSMEVISYGLRFFYNSWGMVLAKDGLILILLWLAWNYPGEVTFREIAGMNFKGTAEIILIVITVLAAWNFLENLVRVSRTALVRLHAGPEFAEIHGRDG